MSKKSDARAAKARKIKDVRDFQKVRGGARDQLPKFRLPAWLAARRK